MNDHIIGPRPNLENHGYAEVLTQKPWPKENVLEAKNRALELSLEEHKRWLAHANGRAEILRKQLLFAAGLISTMDQFSDKHPEEVLHWLQLEAAKL